MASRNRYPSRPTSDEVFNFALEIVQRSQATELLEVLYLEEHPHGGTGRGQAPYTILGFLTALMSLSINAHNRLISDTFRVMCDFTSRQARECGMNFKALAQARSGAQYRVWEKRFRAWLEPRLAVIDPDADIPAVRCTNAEYKAVLAHRSDADWQQHRKTKVRRDTVMNSIVAAAIPDEIKALITGADLITDETILDLVKHSWGMGAAADRKRGAATCGETYRRDKHSKRILNLEVEPSKPAPSKTGYGVGITAVATTGPAHDLYRYPQVVTAIALNEPRGASLDGLRRAIDAHQAAGFDGRSGPRARLRHIVYDTGYTRLDGCAVMCLERGYAAIFRYPANWSLTSASVAACDSANDPEPGPIQIAGAMYCPAVVDRDISRDLVLSGEQLLEGKGYDAHDRRLRGFLPYAMGAHSRPTLGYSTPGRPAGGATPDIWRQQLVCPAALGLVHCPFQYNPQLEPPATAPRANPTWPRSQYKCCSQATVTIGFTDAQLKRAQFGAFIPGSWEHLYYYESARSATERLFKGLKSKAGAGLEHIHEGPRREPAIALIIACAFAAANFWTVDKFLSDDKRPPNPALRKARDLTKDLGREPTESPPRS